MLKSFHLLRFTSRSIRLSYRNYVFQMAITCLTAIVLLASVSTWESLRSGSARFVNELSAGTQLVLSASTSKGIELEKVSEKLAPSDYQSLLAVRFDKGKIAGEETTLIGVDTVGEKVKNEFSKEISKDTILLLGEKTTSLSGKEINLSIGKKQVNIPQEKTAIFSKPAGRAINNANFAVLPLAIYQNLSPNHPQVIFISLPKESSVETAQKYFAEKLPSYEVKPVKEYIDSINNQYEIMASVSYLFSLCFLLGALVLIYASTMIEVTRRRSQFAIIRLIGGKRKTVLLYGLWESLLLVAAPLLIGAAVAHWVIPEIIKQIPPALLTQLPITPAYHFELWIYAIVMALILVGYSISRLVALRRVLLEVDRGIVYLRALLQVNSRQKWTIGLALLGLGVGIAGVCLPAGGGILIGLMLLALIPLTLYGVGRVGSYLAVSHLSGKQSWFLLRWGRELKKKSLIFVVTAIAVTVPVSALLATQALISRGNELVKPLLENDYYLQSAPADSFPTKEFIDSTGIAQIQEVKGIEKAIPGLLVPFAWQGQQFTLQFVDQDTSMPAAVNAGEKALAQVLSDSSSAILTAKAANSLGVGIGEEFTIVVNDRKTTYKVAGISDYIGVNDGQIVLNYQSACQTYRICGASYLEIKTTRSQALNKSDFAQIEFSLDPEEIYLLTGQEEYAVLGQSVAAVSSLSVVLAIQLSFIMLAGLFAFYYSELETRLPGIYRLHRLGMYSSPKLLLRGSGIVKDHLLRNSFAIMIGTGITLFWYQDFALYLEKSMAITGIASKISPAMIVVYALGFWAVLNLLSIVAIFIASRRYKTISPEFR